MRKISVVAATEVNQDRGNPNREEVAASRVPRDNINGEPCSERTTRDSLVHSMSIELRLDSSPRKDPSEIPSKDSQILKPNSRDRVARAAKEGASREEAVSPTKMRVRTKIREGPEAAKANLRTADAVVAKEEAVAKVHQEMICGTSAPSMLIEHPLASSLTRAL